MADRPTASTITDDQLEALYAELDRYVLREIDRTDGEQDQRLAGHGVLHGLAGVARRRTEQRDRARRVAVALENENARLEQQLADTCADGARAEQQLAQVRALHTSSQETRGVGRGSPWTPFCDHCHQDWPCSTIRALDGAQQPETDVVFEGPHTHAPQCGGCDRELSGQAYCRHNGDGIYGTWVAPDACACPQQPEPPREGSVR